MALKTTKLTKIPTIHTQKSPADAGRSLDNIRNFFSDMKKTEGLFFMDGKGNYTPKAIGSDIQPSGSLMKLSHSGSTVVSTTDYISMTIQGRSVMIPILVKP